LCEEGIPVRAFPEGVGACILQSPIEEIPCNLQERSDYGLGADCACKTTVSYYVRETLSFPKPVASGVPDPALAVAIVFDTAAVIRKMGE
jgi:hypothetical protein